MTREEELNARIREIPLSERLERSNSMIAKMCSQHRGPKMTIPVQWDDEDYFICLSVKDARKELETHDALKAENERLREALAQLKKIGAGGIISEIASAALAKDKGEG